MTIFRLENHMLYFHSTCISSSTSLYSLSPISIMVHRIDTVRVIMYHNIPKQYAVHSNISMISCTIISCTLFVLLSYNYAIHRHLVAVQYQYGSDFVQVSWDIAYLRFVCVACFNMFQYASIITPTYFNTLIRVNRSYDRSMLEHATRTNFWLSG